MAFSIGAGSKLPICQLTLCKISRHAIPGAKQRDEMQELALQPSRDHNK